jgi:hypothetical protein
MDRKMTVKIEKTLKITTSEQTLAISFMHSLKNKISGFSYIAKY